MNKSFNLNGKSYQTSSMSKGFRRCVGVCIEETGVTTINTNRPEQGTIHYTLEEWDAFLQGVKKNEFDL